MIRTVFGGNKPHIIIVVIILKEDNPRGINGGRNAMLS